MKPFYTQISERGVYKTEVFIVRKENSEYQSLDENLPWLNPWMVNHVKLLTIIRKFGVFLCEEQLN
jgi:hypothetical protein